MGNNGVFARCVGAVQQDQRGIKVETDRELLELAAKAAGIKLGNYVESIDDYYSEWNGADAFELDGGGYWNPLTEGGNAIRLAHVCNMKIDFVKKDIWYPIGDGNWWFIGWDEDKYRKAIVQAAAEIGKSMQ